MGRRRTHRPWGLVGGVLAALVLGAAPPAAAGFLGWAVGQ